MYTIYTTEHFCFLGADHILRERLRVVSLQSNTVLPVVFSDNK